MWGESYAEEMFSPTRGCPLAPSHSEQPLAIQSSLYEAACMYVVMTHLYLIGGDVSLCERLPFHAMEQGSLPSVPVTTNNNLH